MREIMHIHIHTYIYRKHDLLGLFNGLSHSVSHQSSGEILANIYISWFSHILGTFGVLEFSLISDSLFYITACSIQQK